MIDKRSWRSATKSLMYRLNPRFPRLGALAAVGIAAVAGGSLYAWQNQASAQDPPRPTVTAEDSAPPEVLRALNQADAPAHTTPTAWGLFTINPVINGKALINPQGGQPIPALNSAKARRVEGLGDAGLRRVSEAGLRAIDVPESYRRDMALAGIVVAEDGEQFYRDVGYFAGRDTPEVRTLRVTAFTPTGQVQFEEFPDNAIWDFSNSLEVNGFPTLTVFPDAYTADQHDERIVAWSQGKAVYYIRTMGLFDNAELISLARDISNQELAK